MPGKRPSGLTYRPHHIDGNRQNNGPENLEVVTRSEHAKIRGLGGIS